MFEQVLKRKSILETNFQLEFYQCSSAARAMVFFSLYNKLAKKNVTSGLLHGKKVTLVLLLFFACNQESPF